MWLALLQMTMDELVLPAQQLLLYHSCLQLIEEFPDFENIFEVVASYLV